MSSWMYKGRMNYIDKNWSLGCTNVMYCNVQRFKADVNNNNNNHCIKRFC